MGVEGLNPNEEVQPNPEPAEEPSDPHRGPLDDPDDARFLDKEDERRTAADVQRQEHSDRRENPQISTPYDQETNEEASEEEPEAS